jgi:hypothetical protein
MEGFDDRRTTAPVAHPGSSILWCGSWEETVVFCSRRFCRFGFAALAVYNFGELRLRLNLKRVAIIVLAVYLSSIGWFLVEQIRKEVFYSGATLSSLSFGKMVEAAAEEYDFSFFLAAASARVYLLDPCGAAHQ